jgi:cyclophilin family peptidyl-prolyl cis-trans isomerase
MLRSAVLILVTAFAGVAFAESHEAPAENLAGITEKAPHPDAAIAKIDAFIKSEAVLKQPGWRERLSKPPRVSFDPKKTYKWHLDTNEGPIVIKLMPDVAPMHVTSTIYLTRLGFYDATIFHRIIPNFMAQGGDPTGSGRGGPGYTYSGEYDSKVKHDRPGLLSMANAGPGTDGSQFFLTFVATSHLDGRHTLFGEIVDGMETLEKIEKLGTKNGRPRARVEIRNARVTVE